MVSIGTLLAFTVVCGGIIILRYENDEKPKKLPILVVSYCFACLLASIAYKIDLDKYWWGAWWKYTWFSFSIPLLIIFIILLLQKPSSKPLPPFVCPLVPFIPCLGIFMNIWFISSLSVDSIYRLLIWTTIGMLIYFFYGISHSQLNINHLQIESLNNSSN